MNYIDIQERPKQFAQEQSSTAQLGAGISNIISGVAQQLIQKDAQNTSIKMNNLLSTAFTDIQIEANNYKKQASSDPNNIKLQESFKGKVNLIGEKYLNEVPTGYRNEFLNGFSKLKTTTDNNIKLWQYQQTDLNNKNTIIKQTENLYKQASNFGMNGNLVDAIDSFAVNSSLIKNNAKMMLGEVQANELTKKLEQDYYTNYLNGVLETTPEQIPALMEDKNIINKIGFSNIDKFKKASETKIKNLSEYNVIKETAKLMIDETDFIKKVFNRQVDFITVDNYLNNQNISPNTRDFILKKAGYKDVNNKNQNINFVDKLNTKELIEDRFAQFRISPNTINQDTIKQTYDLIIDYANKGYLSDNETEKYLDELNISNAEFLEYDTEENYKQKRFFSNNFGFEKLKKELDGTFENLGFLKKDGSIKKDNPIQQKVADMKIFAYSTYRNNFDDEIIKYAQENNIALNQDTGDLILNPDGSINTSYSVSRIRNLLSNKDFVRIENNAYKQTLKDLAEYNNIDTENKTPAELKQEIDNKIYNSVNDYNNSIVNEMVEEIYNKSIQKEINTKKQQEIIDYENYLKDLENDEYFGKNHPHYLEMKNKLYNLKNKLSYAK